MLQALEDVRARLGFPKLELDAAPDHVAPEFDEVLDDFEEPEHAGPAAHDGEQRDAIPHLELGVLVEVVEDDVRQLAPLELDDDPHALAARLVAQV